MELTVNGSTVEIDDPSASLLDVLRHQLGLMSVKDGCSPQGQCGCCTVLVDGQARVACVTPARRLRGRSITTLEGLDETRSGLWAEAFCAAGASQCGFCTPGIIMRFEALAIDGATSVESAEQGLLAHLCRCTGWQTIIEAWQRFQGDPPAVESGSCWSGGRDRAAAVQRATIEGGTAQAVGTEVALGRAGFAADTAPSDALIAVADAEGTWVVGSDLATARRAAGKVQGRRTTAAPHWPIDPPPADPGDPEDTEDRTDGGGRGPAMRTTWVDGAYLETDASWCAPGGEPTSVQANGGAFGAKWVESGCPAAIDVTGAARRLANEHDRPVLAMASREDVARFGLKRPPLAARSSADGTYRFRVRSGSGVGPAIIAGLQANRQWAFPGLEPDASINSLVSIEEVDVAGPPTSSRVRAAGWAEALSLAAGVTGHRGPIRAPNGAEARAEIDLGTEPGSAEPRTAAPSGSPIAISVVVRCGRPLDEVVLRSYCIGAAHMAWSWLTSESMLVDEQGVVHDLTVRSFGVIRAVDTPRIEVTIEPDDTEPVNGSDAVFAAVAAAGWQALGCPRDLPVNVGA